MDNSIFNRYAIALLDLSIEDNKVREYREEIKVLMSVFKENHDFIKLLSSKILSTNEVYSFVDEVFSSCLENIKTFIKVIYINGRIFYLYQIFKETLYRFDDYLKIERGTFYSPDEISDDDYKKIVSKIEEEIKKTLDLKRVIDKSLIGGFKIELKNDIYDTSIKQKIQNLKQELNKE